MIKDIGHMSRDFSLVLMYLLHTIHHTTVEEMKTRKHVLFDLLKNSKHTITTLKNKVKET